MLAHAAVTCGSRSSRRMSTFNAWIGTSDQVTDVFLFQLFNSSRISSPSLRWAFTLKVLFPQQFATVSLEK